MKVFEVCSTVAVHVALLFVTITTLKSSIPGPESGAGPAPDTTVSGATVFFYFGS